MTLLAVAGALALSGGVAAASSRSHASPARSATMLPSGVRRVNVVAGYPGQRPVTAVRVTRPRTVRRIVGWLEELHVARPGKMACPAISMERGRAIFSFRGAHGVVLARARVLAVAGTATACNPIELSVRGRAQTFLVGDFLGRVQRLLGVRLVLPPPTAS
ncbi:MAG TPA: hypothetical protein VE088_08555 [Gaiellaceae bacterium]|nr:hypothetical protein [Gaiellaceae bacterium]